MQNKLIIISIFSFIIGKVNAQQQQGSNSFSLQQAIEYAYKNSPNYLNAQSDVVMAKYKRKEVLGIAMPQISGSVDMKNFIVIPTQILPNFVAPEVYKTLVKAKMAPPDPKLESMAGYDPIAAQFGTRYQTTAGLNASLLVFSADYLVGLKATKEYISLMNINVTRSKTETVSSVSKAYYGVLVNKERIKLLDANLEKLGKLLSDSKAFNQQGFIEKIDVERLEVAHNNLLTEKQKIENLIALSENVLKFQMGYTGKEHLTLSDSLVLTDKTEADVTKIEYSKRPEYQLLESQQKLYDINVKRLKMGYLPSLVAFGSLSASGMGNDLEYVGYLKKYYQTQLIGATLSLNVFDGFQRHYKIQQAKLDRTKGEYNIKNLQLAIELESASSAVNYNNAIASLQMQKRNLELAENIYNVSQKKYEQGVGSNLEVINAQTSLKEAETNYFNAIYDMLVYKIDYLKSTGNLVK